MLTFPIRLNKDIFNKRKLCQHHFDHRIVPICGRQSLLLPKAFALLHSVELFLGSGCPARVCSQRTCYKGRGSSINAYPVQELLPLTKRGPSRNVSDTVSLESKCAFSTYMFFLHLLAGCGQQGNVGSQVLKTTEPPSAWIPECLQEVELLHFQPTRSPKK